MQLIYRGFVFNGLSTARQTIAPRAVNWRYCVPGQPTNAMVTRETILPRAINWRYQVPEMV